MVLLAARGSSDHAALFGRYLIEVHLGIPVSLAAPSVLTRYGTRVRYQQLPGRGHLPVRRGAGRGGGAPRPARGGRHATVGITNTEGSRLAGSVDVPVLLGVGREASVAATKTYTASLLAMVELVRALGADLPAWPLPDDAWIGAV